jgi:phosphoribosyl 1,2-cyclic phosphodiesterase
MARFCPLASSSSGNSTYISCSSGSLIVDAGISCRALGKALSSIGAGIEDLDAVLITHEHIDHIKGLKIITKNYKVKVIADASVLEFLAENDHVAPGTCLIPAGDCEFEAAGMTVTPFATEHDCRASLGYKIRTCDGHNMAVATDLGAVTDSVKKGMSGSGLVLLESNHDPDMLRAGSYPPYLKRRIASECGHLSNHESKLLARFLLGQGCTRFVLGHLSRENNSPALAYQTVRDELALTGAIEGVDYLIDVAPYYEPGRLVRF